MAIWDEMSQIVVPLFDFLKYPCYPGYRGSEPLNAAARYMQHAKREGRPLPITGKYVLLNGYGAVVDLEGRKWKAVSETQLPAWLRAVRDASVFFPSWVSAGGDGGKGLNNFLLPFQYRDIVAGLGLQAVSGNTHRVPLGGEGKAELLLKCGVCIPTSTVVSDECVRSVVEWVPGAGGQGWGSDVGPVLQDAVATCVKGGVMRDLIAVLAGEVKNAADAGIIAGVGDTGAAPVVKEIEHALWSAGPNEGLRVTFEMLGGPGGDGNGLRHYAVKTWTNWALSAVGDKLLQMGGGTKEGALRVLGEQIIKDWAGAFGYEMNDVMKSVRDEAKFLGWSASAYGSSIGAGKDWA